ncbi:MAG: hypothetical protein Q8P20_03320 [bacterium]|nr:hypothetical protein [bacterium]
MPTQIPSFMQNTPSAPKKPFPSTPNDSIHPKRSFSRMLMFVIALLAIGGITAYYLVVVVGDDSNQDENQLVVVDNTNQNTNQEISNSNNNQNVNLNTNTISNTNADSNINSINNTNKYIKIVELSDYYTDEQLAQLTEEQKAGILEEFQEDFLISEEYLLNDSDMDSVLSTVEQMYGTSVDNPDTDGDGYDDFMEINGCYNPNGSGRLSLQSYHDYCSTIFSEVIEAGITTTDMVNDLCTIWDDYVEQEIIRKENNSEVSVWENTNQEEFVEVCDQFDTKYSIEESDDLISLCNSSYIYVASFCNVTEAALSY